MDFFTLAPLGDCEAIHEGWLKQPVNAWSSLAFSIVGLGVALSAAVAKGRERFDRIVFGSLLATIGLGSFLFHGPQPGAAQFLHDITFLSALWYLGVANITGALAVSTDRSVVLAAAGIASIAAVLVIAPGTTNALVAILAGGLLATDVALWRRSPPARGWYLAALASLGIGVTMFVAGRTGSPICDSAGLLQAHAGWHLLAAVFLGTYFFATLPARTQGRL